ncbi:uncharacterized protein LOC119666484 [Teleopsis dalmanni]|uniref:uncharacterized protein LOC119666484 n=1 Tax=Teleopsis dalmanni TaxID=139649 RepID=UPI0018CD1B49|nr:uncharacterized protein LOC119666484 [Teleopsis dalmanni]
MIHTTAYHPQSNGLIERWHRTFKAALKCHKKKNWVEALPLVLLGLRCKILQNENVSIAKMVYGSTIKLPGDLFETHSKIPPTTEWMHNVRNNMNNLQPAVTTHNSNQKEFIHSELNKCSFVRCDAVKKPQQNPYNGPCKDWKVQKR